MPIKTPPDTTLLFCMEYSETQVATSSLTD